MEVKVLDHGYIKLIESWGSDERVIESARMSTNKGFLGWGPKEDGKPGDEKLLRYLWENKHVSPFEMAGVVIEVQLPIFVARQWMTHWSWSFNEHSARYSELPELYYVPSAERLRLGGQSKSNKQASGTELPSEVVLEAALIIEQACKRDFADYRRLLELGVSREISRGVLNVNTYTRMRASANLRDLLFFQARRMPADAQWEIRQFANALHDILTPLFPRTMGLFDER